MKNTERSYIVGEDGKRTAVVVALDEYDRLLDALEELESIRAYDAAKASGEKPVPFDEAMDATESSRP